MATHTVANPSDVAGAAACLALLQQIDRLPIVQVHPRDDLGDAEGGPDDGKRMDYAAADGLLGEALDSHGTNRGFRQALANFLLGELQNGTTNLTNLDARYLLTDGGFRPITEEAADATLKGMPAKAREQMGVYAAGEIEALGRMLRREQNEDGFESVLNGSLIRIAALASVLLSINGSDERREWAEMHEVVFGEPLEVVHD